jgi:succinate dehydrogenase/fumarate reductase flavoprotein subunit
MTQGLVAGALMLGSVIAATPALAHVVEVTTALEMPDARDASAVKAALQAAVERIISETIAFKPTMVALTDARVMGEKLLVRLLIADADGERMLKDLQGDTGSASPDEEDQESDETHV